MSERPSNVKAWTEAPEAEALICEEEGRGVDSDPQIIQGLGFRI